MKTLVTGAGGFVGGRLLERLCAATDRRTDPAIVAVDLMPTKAPRAGVAHIAGDIGDADFVAELIDDDVTTIFHLAGVVSAGAEADYDLGYRVNVGGLQNLIAACRRLPAPPRMVFASSIAVYGGVADIDDATPLRPRTSYGAQKAIGELLLNDATRKGFIDGRALRLSAVVVRPTAPNAAASAFTSTIIREPVRGRPAICPVASDVPLPMVSAAYAVDALIALQRLDGAALGPDRAVLLGALSPSAAEIAASLDRICGPDAGARIAWQSDPSIQAFVRDWPQTIRAQRAAELGLRHDAAIDDIVANFLKDERREDE